MMGWDGERGDGWIRLRESGEDMIDQNDEGSEETMTQVQIMVRCYAVVWVGDGSECSTRSGLDAFLTDMARAEAPLLEEYGVDRLQLAERFFDAVAVRLDEMANEHERAAFNAAVEASW